MKMTIYLSNDSNGDDISISNELIQTAWWIVRTLNAVKTRSVNEVNSATPFLLL